MLPASHSDTNERFVTRTAQLGIEQADFKMIAPVFSHEFSTFVEVGSRQIIIDRSITLDLTAL